MVPSSSSSVPSSSSSVVRRRRRPSSSSVVVVRRRRRPSKYYLQDVAEASLGRWLNRRIDLSYILDGPQHIQYIKYTKYTKYINIQNKPLRFAILDFWNFWKCWKRYFDVFGRFSKLIALSVSAVACAWFFAIDSAIFYLKSCPERSGETKTDVQKKLENKFSKKVCLSTLCGPQNSQTYPLVMYSWYKISKEIGYLAIPWQSWQTWFKPEKLTNIPPTPAVGGFYRRIDLSYILDGPQHIQYIKYTKYTKYLNIQKI